MVFFYRNPPTKGVTAQDQREESVKQMVEQGFPNIKADDWSDVFFALSKEISEGPVLIVLDEIAWMGSKDATSWETIMGLQFENLVVQNSRHVMEKLKVPFKDYIYDGPYFQTKTQRKKGCQIDYLIQTKGTLYICEIKFSKNPIGSKVIEAIQRKIEALVIPRYVSYRPVLIHVGGVTDEVLGRDYFDKIIDWSELISKQTT